MEEVNKYFIYKWLKSENASNKETKMIADKIREYFKLSHRQYRKLLSKGRENERILERLMSLNRWEEIEFDKIPSRAGMIYRNAFARRGETKEQYKDFAKDTTTKVNANVLYPHEVVHKAFKCDEDSYESTERLMLQKYWENLKDIYQGREENAIAVVDVSGSMSGTPIEAAIGLGMYIAERGKGPFANHFITFSEIPNFEEIKGVDIVDKIGRMASSDWGYNTDIEAVFNLLLEIAKDENVKADDIPQRLYILSDMEFDEGLDLKEKNVNTLLENIAEKWYNAGYELPQLIFWNLDARQQNIPLLKGARFGYISGFSTNIIDSVLTGKDGIDLMLEKLKSNRYNDIKIKE